MTASWARDPNTVHNVDQLWRVTPLSGSDQHSQAFVIDNLTAQVNFYEDVAAKMRERMEALPKGEQAELEEVAAALRRVRAGGDHQLLPLTVVSKNGA
ncbi:hypothetical protein [Streptomyces kronopolitis]|uniref:hypothetical protein n=1 Tax=Streptomyces kronopolitis TaxID=1612435 RepID=UPI0036B8F50C